MSLNRQHWKTVLPILPRRSETSNFCNHFHKNHLPAMVELLTTGLIRSLYQHCSNCPIKTGDTQHRLWAWQTHLPPTSPPLRIPWKGDYLS